jgi:hypothetical protein
VGALDAFMTTWSRARATMGYGSPRGGARFDSSAELRQAHSTVESAAPGPRWTGSAADCYAQANSHHGRLLGQMARLDQRLGAEVDRSATVVAAGRQNLHDVKRWVLDAAASLPQGADRDQALMPLARKAIGDVADILEQSHADLGAIGARIRAVGTEYHALAARRTTGGHDPVDGEACRNHDLWTIVSKSPTLNREYQQLIRQHWRISYDGEPEKGTYTDSTTKTIFIDGLEKDDHVLQARSLAHEFGHALNPVRDQTTQNLLDNEGIATMNNIEIQRQIMANGGPDIGIAGNDPGTFDFNTVYDQYVQAGSTPAAYQKAVEMIGNWYGDNLHPSTRPDLTYRQYYDQGGR